MVKSKLATQSKRNAWNAFVPFHRQLNAFAILILKNAIKIPVKWRKNIIIINSNEIVVKININENHLNLLCFFLSKILFSFHLSNSYHRHILSFHPSSLSSRFGFYWYSENDIRFTSVLGDTTFIRALNNNRSIVAPTISRSRSCLFYMTQGR